MATAATHLMEVQDAANDRELRLSLTSYRDLSSNSDIGNGRLMHCSLVHLGCALHPCSVKRTRLMLPEHLLREVVQFSGEKTLSRAVILALQEFVRRAPARQILELRGTGAWEGDLAEMRGVASARPRKKARRSCWPGGGRGIHPDGG